jgi:hypothetical protein
MTDFMKVFVVLADRERYRKKYRKRYRKRYRDV